MLTSCFRHFYRTFACQTADNDNYKNYVFLFSGPTFVPGASAPGDNTPLETFVDDSVSRALIKYFEDKGDPGKQEVLRLVIYS